MVIVSFRYSLAPFSENRMIGISPALFLQAGMLNWSEQNGFSLVCFHSFPYL